MDFLSRKQPVTPEEHVALLPEGLRSVIDRELAAGNALLEAGGGFPAAPVGLWVKLARPFLTATQPPPANVVFSLRPVCQWPAEFTDPPRHNFVICVEGPVRTASPPVREAGQKSVAHAIESGQRDPDELGEREERPLHVRVNQAIETHLCLWITPEIEAAITASCGADALALVHEICSFAETPAFWMHGPHLDNYYQVRPKIREKYPFLTYSAVVRVATSAAYGWK